MQVVTRSKEAFAALLSTTLGAPDPMRPHVQRIYSPVHNSLLNAPREGVQLVPV